MLKIKRLFIIFLILIILSPLAFIYFNVSGYKLYLRSVENYSDRYGVDKYLVLAIIKTESNFKVDVVSSKGAVGLMQIMPSTARFIAGELNVKNYDLLDSETSINFGVFYLSYLTKKYREERLVICAYNAGEGRVNDWLKHNLITKNKTPYKETTIYLKRVNLRKKLYKRITY